ncbi:hypothetical protein DTL42_11635 [Bremerella cremea]|uniref:Uncharacterized protein n=1 Tax=Bremerella cremea TaxID=1031537 RepID=A0A368KQM6_9BACT|nr:hypothetical protein [Bremerella cremea]RCS49185.1 hypothetical protein DTL42_11635 [Bremerella cremea]
MTFDEFEITLQDWLDEGRLAEVEILIPLVRESDREQCQELLDTYRALFVGLAAKASVPGEESPSAAIAARPQPVPVNTAGQSRIAAKGLLALAACLAIVAMMPGLLPFGGGASDPVASPVAQSNPIKATATNGSILAQANSSLVVEESGFSLFTTASLEPLARGMASQTDTAFRSLNQVSRDYNPIDQPIAAYREAAPLIETLTDGFLPGTRSLSSAFSVLKESATDPVPHAANTQQQPADNGTPENAAVI